MTNFSLRTLDLPTLHRHAIGFDRIFDELNRTFANSKNDGNYPPYNVINLPEDKFIIEVAVAGFEENELDVEVRENILTIKGTKTTDKDVNLDYLHKGISDRNFTRTFTLNSDIHVKGATVKNGILAIALELIVPEEQKPKKIAIAFQK
jgi:molecular chaperone IbpA